jgi:protein phosphatase
MKQTVCFMGAPDLAGLSDVGRCRAENEDRLLVAELTRSMRILEGAGPAGAVASAAPAYLLLVADGMGGAPAGARASALAARTLARYVLEVMPWHVHLAGREAELEVELRRAALRCQARIEAEVARHPERAGMGTTLTAAYVAGASALVAHVGDSRCYLYRDGALGQVTRDHTMARMLVDQGILAAASPACGRFSRYMVNVIGGDSSAIEADVFRLALRPGDALLLCTDGLPRHVGDAEMARILGEGRPALETCRKLVAAANDAGGRDNVTVALARFPKTTNATVDFVVSGRGRSVV